MGDEIIASAGFQKRRSGKGKLGFVFGMAAASLVIVTLFGFHGQAQSMAHPTSIIYDTRFIDAMKNLSGIIPANATLVASTNAPLVAYFTGHPVTTPYRAISEKSLVKYMADNKYGYLVVFEGKSSVKNLETLFSRNGLKDLDADFERIASYATESNKIHVFRLRAAK